MSRKYLKGLGAHLPVEYKSKSCVISPRCTRLAQRQSTSYLRDMTLGWIFPSQRIAFHSLLKFDALFATVLALRASNIRAPAKRRTGRASAASTSYA